MKLKDEQGNEWDFFLLQDGDEQGVLGYLSKKKPNPMPELEKGDWCMSTLQGMNVWIDSPMGREEREAGRIIEIRKANGTVWRMDR